MQALYKIPIPVEIELWECLVQRLPKGPILRWCDYKNFSELMEIFFNLKAHALYTTVSNNTMYVSFCGYYHLRVFK